MDGTSPRLKFFRQKTLPGHRLTIRLASLITLRRSIPYVNELIHLLPAQNKNALGVLLFCADGWN